MFNDYEIVKMLSDANNYRAQQQAAAYGAQSQTGGAGGIGAILAGINGYRSKKKGEEAGQLEVQAQQAMMEQEKAQLEQQQQALIAQRNQKLQALIPLVGEQKAVAMVDAGVSMKDIQPQQTTLQKNLADPTSRAHLEKQASKAGVTVNNNMPGTKYGKIDNGYMMKETPDGPVMVPVPGSLAEREAKQRQSKTQMKGLSGFQDSENIDQVIGKAKEQADGFTTGLGGAIAGLIPGTDARNLQENMKTIEADAAFSSLQNMRDNSVSGGALGQVSERELGLLSSAKAALSTSQSPEQFKENLGRYQSIRQKAMQNTAKAYEMDFGQPAPWLPKEQEQPEKQNPTPDGTIIENAQGVRMIMQNGKWVQQ